MSYVVREVQSTPNPNAMKWVLDRTISPTPLSFRSAVDADAHPVAKALMALKGVSAVLLLNDFVTINKSPEARWAEIKTKANRILAAG